jgi:hypothetical protein
MGYVIENKSSAMTAAFDGFAAVIASFVAAMGV